MGHSNSVRRKKLPLRFGIAGCGASVLMFGPAFSALEEATASCWMDPDREKAVDASKRYGGVAVDRFEDLIDTGEIDALIVASPPWEHERQTIMSLDAGVSVLCEKPMARDAAECRRMRAAAEASNEILMIGFMKRFDPAFEQAKAIVDSGEIGEVYEFTSRWGWPQYFLAGWRDTKRTGGGLFKDHGSHSVDLARWFLGEAVSVTAEMQSRLAGREVEDFAHAVYRHTTGAISVHHHSRLTHRLMEEYYRIEGTKGCLEIVCEGVWSYASVRPFSLYLSSNTVGIQTARRRVPQDSRCAVDEQVRREYRYSREISYFVECVAEGRRPDKCTPTDGTAAVEAIDGAYLSSVTGRRVNLPIKEAYAVDDLLDRIRLSRPQ